MNDRELLAAAAKAADLVATPEGDVLLPAGPATGEFRLWNPLTDDGDALRLAVKLRLYEALKLSHRLVSGDGEDSFYAAARRSIVRAAALCWNERMTNVAEWLLYEHDDGRHAVAPSAEAAAFAHGNPKWHRVGPVEPMVPCPVCGGEAVHAQDVLARTFISLRDAKDAPAYRLLKPGEHIANGDEVLSENAATWVPLVGWDLRVKWDGSRLMPMRRRIPALCGNDAETVAEKPKEKPLKSTA